MNTPTHADQARFATELQTSSDSSFNYLVTCYQSKIYNLVYTILSDAADPAEVTREAFLQVFRGIRGFRQTSSLKTLIYREAVQRALKHQRWCWLHPRQSSSDVEEEGSLKGREFQNVEFATQKVKARVRRALALVPIQFRSAVILRDVEGLSYEEVAEVLDLTVRTVKSRILRGRRILKELLYSSCA